MKILLVDDQPQILEMIEELFKMRGLNDITTATNQAGAEAELSRAEFDLVFTDFEKPVNGLSILARARQLSSRTKVIIASGTQDEEAIASIQISNADGFLRKPFQVEEFFGMLKTLQFIT